MPLTAEQKAAVGEAIGATALTPLPNDERLVVRFDASTQTVFRQPESGKRSSTVLAGAVCLQYVENGGARTPTGGRYTSRRMTIRTRDGRRWVGTMPKGSDVVKLRPLTVKEDNAKD